MIVVLAKGVLFFYTHHDVLILTERALVLNNLFSKKKKHWPNSKWLSSVYYWTSLWVHMLLKIFSA